MRLRLILLSVVAVLLAAARPASADLPDVVKRYIDDTTLIVGRMDVTELSSEAIVTFMSDLMREAPEAERERLMGRMKEGLTFLDEQLAPLRERGVLTSWFIMGANSFVMGEPALTIVPVENDEQAQAVMDLLAKERESHRRVEGAVLIGTRNVLRSAQALRPVDRPALGAPIRVGRGAPAFQVSFEPTPFVRLAAEMGARELAAQTPQFPPEIIDLIPGLESMSLAIDLPPSPRASLMLEFLDQELPPVAQKMIEGQLENVERVFRRAEIDEDRAKQLAGAFAPETKGKRVIIELTAEELRERVGPVMVLTMIRDREGAARVRSGANLRKLSQAILLWTYEHGDGRLPDELAVVEQVFTDPKVDGTTWRLVNRNPRFAADDAYAYVRPADRLDAIKEPEITVLAYEKPPADGIREGVNVAFADGRVEWLVAADFEELAALQKFEIQTLPR